MFEFIWTESSIKTMDGLRATLCARSSFAIQIEDYIVKSKFSLVNDLYGNAHEHTFCPHHLLFLHFSTSVKIITERQIYVV